MKKILTYGLSLLVAATSSMSLSSCIDEAEMTQGATEEQVNETSDSPEYFVMGIPAQLNSLWNTSYAFAWGYGAIMHIRDVQTQDIMHNDGGTGYDWFAMWEQNEAMGRDYLYNQFIWNTMYECINSTNKVFESVDSTAITDDIRGYFAAAHAYRAMLYLDLARCYEWLPNDVTQPVSIEGNDITGLTVPIVKEGMSEEQKRNNPRATKDEMAAFILSDLNQAEQLMQYLTTTDKTLPHLDCVYGLYARYYMWLENYPEAERYARLAIDEASTAPMTQTDCLDPITGFNDLNKWMWGLQYTESSLQHSLMNWVAWLCNEVEYGYTAVAPVLIDAQMYSRISNTDFRKLEWKAPAGSTLDGQNTYCDPEYGENLADYASLKFRPNEVPHGLGKRHSADARRGNVLHRSRSRRTPRRGPRHRTAQPIHADLPRPKLLMPSLKRGRRCV